MWTVLACLAGLLLLSGLGLVWNEARKEVVYLCGNFAPGVTDTSVRRQLDTGHFLRYRIEGLPPGRRIVADSAYNLLGDRCVVEFDAQGAVTRAWLE